MKEHVMSATTLSLLPTPQTDQREWYVRSVIGSLYTKKAPNGAFLEFVNIFYLPDFAPQPNS
jgi:hypothetical protein